LIISNPYYGRIAPEELDAIGPSTHQEAVDQLFDFIYDGYIEM
jgi:hypothetical protein